MDIVLFTLALILALRFTYNRGWTEGFVIGELASRERFKVLLLATSKLKAQMKLVGKDVNDLSEDEFSSKLNQILENMKET